MDFNYVFKVVMVGEAGVGKTSLMYNYVYGSPPAESRITIGVEVGSRIIEMSHDDQKVKLHIWDTSGQEKFRSITRSYYRGAAGCIVLYDVTRRSSFNRVLDWVNDMRSLAPTNHTVIMLVGTKTDLEDERVISKEEGEALAEQEGLLFAETNFTERPETVFRTLGEDIYGKRDVIQSGVRENTVKPPSGAPPLSKGINESCCLFPFYGN